MKTYKKLHESKEVANIHIAKIKERGGEVKQSVQNGKILLEYSFACEETIKGFFNDRELIGMAEITKDGYFKASCQRFGSKYGDSSRGGTWYEIPAYEGAKSSYESGWWGSREANMGVGGKEKHERIIVLKNPYFQDWTGYGEGKIIIKLSNDILGKEITIKLKKGITGVNSEKAFAKIESAISQSLKKQGHDGIVLYDSIGKMIHPKQLFLFS